MDENNDLRPELSQEQMRKQGAQNAAKDIAEVGAKGIATAVGGPLGGKVADLALKTKLGQQLTNKAGQNLTKQNPALKKALENKKVQNAVHTAKPIADQAVSASGGSAGSDSTSTGSGLGQALSGIGGGKSKGLFKSLFGSNSTAKAELNDETPGEFTAGQDVLNLIKKLFAPMLASFGFGGCGGFLLIAVIVAIVMTPIMYVNDVIDGAKNFGEHLVNLLLGNGWSSDAEAEQKAIEDFYKEVDVVYEKYKTILQVELDYDLIVSTLTWYAPPSTEDMVAGEGQSNMKFMKKSKAKVNTLAEYMVSCYLDLLGESIEVPCGHIINNDLQEIYKYLGSNGSFFHALKSWELGIIESGAEAIVSLITRAELNLDKYRDYLLGNIIGQPSFIRKYYYDMKFTPRVEEMIPVVTDEIFARAAYFKYLNGNGSSGGNKVYATCQNGVTVNNNGTIENYTLDQYVAATVCPNGNCAGKSEEAIKAESIAVRTQVLNQTNNCTVEVVNNSISSDIDDNILSLVQQTNGQIIIDGNTIYNLSSVDINKIIELANKGYTYEEILKELFGDNTNVSGMVNIQGGDFSSSSLAPSSVSDLKKRAEYYASIGEVELAGKIIDLANLYSSGSGLISQCPWYAKSRALELIYNSNMSDEEKLKAYKAIEDARGNGTSWYDDIPSLNNFEKSSNVYEPKVGAIISWSSNANKAGHSYGHVAIIEKIDEEKGIVTISESYNSAGPDAANNWNNVSYRLREFTFEELKNYKGYGNGGYSFNGYVYILG